MRHKPSWQSRIENISRHFDGTVDKFRIIMITGTNGKTTTSRIAAGMLEQSGIMHVTNKSGANLVMATLHTTLISSLTLTGKALVRTALLETDEAAFIKELLQS